jgi:NADH:ubiquinone oxidoreductase subunit 6 (subunit J)
MTPEAVIFYCLAALTLVSGAVVVLSRSLITSAFALLFTFMGVAGLYFALGADFLAAVQILIYVGGILVLLVFGVMLTHRLYDLDLRSERRGFTPSVILTALLFGILLRLALRTEWFAAAQPAVSGPTTSAIGKLFLGRFILPFEVASVVLLVALIGAALIVRRRRDA